MAEDGPRDEAGKRGDPEIAAAEWLFRDDPAEKPAKPAGVRARRRRPGEGETFDLADGPFDEAEEAAVPPMPAAPARGPARHAAARRRQAEDRPDRRIVPDRPEALVDVVWSRGAEWGPNLLIVGAWVLAVAMIVYFLMGWVPFGLTFLLLLVGAAGRSS